MPSGGGRDCHGSRGQAIGDAAQHIGLRAIRGGAFAARQVHDLRDAIIQFLYDAGPELGCSRGQCRLLWRERVRKAEEDASKRYGEAPVNW